MIHASLIWSFSCVLVQFFLTEFFLSTSIMSYHRGGKKRIFFLYFKTFSLCGCRFVLITSVRFKDSITVTSNPVCLHRSPAAPFHFCSQFFITLKEILFSISTGPKYLCEWGSCIESTLTKTLILPDTGDIVLTRARSVFWDGEMPDSKKWSMRPGIV